MDLDLDLDSIFNGFGSGFGFKCVLGLDWILDLKKFMDLDLDLDLFLDMDSNPNPRIQIRTSLLSRTGKNFFLGKFSDYCLVMPPAASLKAWIPCLEPVLKYTDPLWILGGPWYSVQSREVICA